MNYFNSCYKYDKTQSQVLKCVQSGPLELVPNNHNCLSIVLKFGTQNIFSIIVVDNKQNNSVLKW